MKFKRKRKQWLFAAFITILISSLLSLISIFAYNSERNPIEKVAQWMILFVFISCTIAFYLEYKKEVKKEIELKKNKSDMQ